MIKKVLFSLVILLGITTAAYAYSYATDVPLPGESQADIKLQENSLFTVYMFAHRFAKPDCKEFSIIDTKVSKERVDNSWQEIWVVKACSKTAEIPVNFSLKNDKATYGIDPMGVRVFDNN